MTPHISAKKNEIAKTVIMPGDPLRAKFMAEKYLENYRLVSNVRSVGVYTGFYRGIEITIMASGMGIPSMGIYSYELFKFYDVENIIRIGSCGSYDAKINLYDLILVTESYSESNYANELNDNKTKIIKSDDFLTDKIEKNIKNDNYFVGRIYCSEAFYKEKDYREFYQKGCLGVEMETFALFHNAKKLNKKAACLLTVSDSLVTHEKTSSEEREQKFTEMMEVVLNAVVDL